MMHNTDLDNLDYNQILPNLPGFWQSLLQFDMHRRKEVSFLVPFLLLESEFFILSGVLPDLYVMLVPLLPGPESAAETISIGWTKPNPTTNDSTVAPSFFLSIKPLSMCV